MCSSINESNRDIFSWKAISLKTPCTGSKSVTGILRQLTDQHWRLEDK